MDDVWINWWLICLIIKVLKLSLFKTLQRENMSVDTNILTLRLMEGPWQYSHQQQFYWRVNIFVVLLMLPNNDIQVLHCLESFLAFHSHICVTIFNSNSYKPMLRKYVSISIYVWSHTNQVDVCIRSLDFFKSCNLKEKYTWEWNAYFNWLCYLQ